MRLRPPLFFAALFALHAGTALCQSAPDGDVVRGKQIFASYGCYQCHGYQGQGSNSGSKLAPGPLPYAAFAFLVRQPRARMPPYPLTILSDQDMADIHAYLVTLPEAKTVAEIPLLAAPR